jgi:hypothetical protein
LSLSILIVGLFQILPFLSIVMLNFSILYILSFYDVNCYFPIDVTYNGDVIFTTLLLNFMVIDDFALRAPPVYLNVFIL